MPSNLPLHTTTFDIDRHYATNEREREAFTAWLDKAFEKAHQSSPPVFEVTEMSDEHMLGVNIEILARSVSIESRQKFAERWLAIGARLMETAK